MSLHTFSPEIAKLVGVNAAVIYEYFSKHWEYGSVKVLNRMYPFLTISQIRTALKKLVNTGLLESQITNEIQMDRTLSYRILHEGSDT